MTPVGRILSVLLLASVTLTTRAQWIAFSEDERTAPPRYEQINIVAASDGHDFLTAWIGRTPGGAMPFARAVRANGTIQGAAATPLQAETSTARGLSLSRGRDAYFAAWHSTAGEHVAILDAFGRVMRRTNTARAIADSYSTTRTAWNGAAHLVLSLDGGSFSATIYDNDANAIATNLSLGTVANAVDAAVITDDAGFVVMIAVQNLDTSEIRARRVTTSGVAGEWFVVRFIATMAQSLAAISENGRMRVAWGDIYGLWLAELDPRTAQAVISRQLAPSPMTARGIAFVGDRTIIAAQPLAAGRIFTIEANGTISEREVPAAGALATNGSQVLFAGNASSWLPGLHDTMAQIIEPVASAELLVAATTPEQYAGRIASNGAHIAAVWEETSADGPDIYFNRVAYPPSAGVRLSDGPLNAAPDLAWNGTEWLVVWRRGGGVELQLAGRRVSATGIPVGDPFVIADGMTTHARVASDGKDWIVVWHASVPRPACGNIGNGTRVHAAKVAADGTLLATNVELDAPGNFDATDPEIAWNGSAFAIAWREACVPFRASGTFAVAAGTLDRELASWNIATLPGSSRVYGSPQLIARDGASLVAWADGPGRVTYRFFGSEAAPSRTISRRRAVSLASTLFEGTLLGLSLTPQGRFTILTQRPLAQTTDALGWFEHTIDNGLVVRERAVATNPPGLTYTGNIATLPAGQYIAVARFEPYLNAQRMLLQTMPGD
jgi:hypothetical protein